MDDPKWHHWMGKGFFPEVLPPCFVSTDFKRAFHGLGGKLKEKTFHNRRAARYIRYNGTKHNGNRRAFGTSNPIHYYYISQFLSEKWTLFEQKFEASPYSVSRPRLGREDDDRTVIVPSLSGLSTRVSESIRYAPYILKTDVAQFFPSIYTHSIAWAAHGIEESKADTAPKSSTNAFNRRDFFVQNTQQKNSRGVLVGPDAYRAIAEFIACEIDSRLHAVAADLIIGGVRHVDDFYLGVGSEADALAVLSALRDCLQTFELQLNDGKTTILNGLTPIDDVWAQELRAMPLYEFGPMPESETVVHFLDKAFEQSQLVKSESPIKIAIRRLDQSHVYLYPTWQVLEHKLQRMLFHFPHSIDYIALLVVKRDSIGGEIDEEGWKQACENVIQSQISLGHHHEIVWLLWLMFSCRLELSASVADQLSRVQNAHVQSLLVQAYVDGRNPHDPKLKFRNRLASTEEDWLTNLVARSSGYTKARFGGALNHEFEHLAKKKVQLIDFESHIEKVGHGDVDAISSSRYGYDAEDEDDDDDEIEIGDWDDHIFY